MAYKALQKEISPLIFPCTFNHENILKCITLLSVYNALLQSPQLNPLSLPQTRQSQYYSSKWWQFLIKSLRLSVNSPKKGTELSGAALPQTRHRSVHNESHLCHTAHWARPPYQTLAAACHQSIDQELLMLLLLTSYLPSQYYGQRGYCEFALLIYQWGLCIAEKLSRKKRLGVHCLTCERPTCFLVYSSKVVRV